MLKRSKGKGREAGPPPRPWSVLLVADDPDGVELVSRVLSDAGHSVSVATTRPEALGAIGGSPYHCVVLDLTVSNTNDNLELLDAVRAHDDSSVAATPVVLLGGPGISRIYAWKAGVDASLERPFDASLLVSSLTEAVERPDAERSSFRGAQLQKSRGDLRE